MEANVDFGPARRLSYDSRAYLLIGGCHGKTGAETEAQAIPAGGILPRMHPGHSITVYVTAPSVDKAVVKVQKLSGTVCKPKTAVPHMGYFAICEDTEHNTFALWEMTQRAA